MSMYGDAPHPWRHPAAPVAAMPTPDERVLAALYTHSPAGLGQLALVTGVEVREPLERLVRAGKVVYRQIGEVVIYALVGAMGA